MGDIDVLLPTKAAETVSTGLSSRPAKLDGARIGFIWNSKPNADVLFDEFVARIGHPEDAIQRHLKPNAAVPALDEVYDAFAADCQAAVVALGD